MSLNGEFYDFLIKNEIQQFIRDHEYVDINTLLLNPPKLIQAWKKEIIAQLVARKKCKTKLPLWYQTPNIYYPPPLSVEQSSSTITAQHKGRLVKGSVLYDLTGGMGIDCMALAIHFDTSYYVEQNKDLCHRFSVNQELLGPGNINIQHESAEEALAHIKTSDVIYLDPARRNVDHKKIFQFDDCTPNIKPLLSELRKKSQSIMIKASPMIDLSKGLRDLGSVAEIHIISVRNECKEIIFILNNESYTPPTLYCVNLDSLHPLLQGNFTEEKSLSIEYCIPKNIILDPNTSILKAGLFKTIGHHYGLSKIAINTHFYTSDKKLKDFPGRQFEVISSLNKKNIKKLLPARKANVITKNYPISAGELKSQWGLNDGGNYFILGFRNQENEAQCWLTKKID